MIGNIGAFRVKILQMNLKKGFVKVLPESLDDLWHLYNVIYKNDEVHARTTREVKNEKDLGRPKEGKRVPVFLGVRVAKVIWDRSLNRLRVQGIVCEAPEKINVTGSHHTINISVNKPVTIIKAKWPKHQVDRLKRASETTAPPILLLSIDDEEYCVAVLRQYGIDTKAQKKTMLPGKLEAEKREKATQEYFRDTLHALQDEWQTARSSIVVLGPGFVKNDFVKYMQQKASDVARSIVDVKGVNSAGMAGINEALRSGILTKTLKQLRIVEENRVMEEALARLGKGSRDVTYGFDEVRKADTFGAVDKLLLADVTLREASDDKRLELEELMKKIEEKGGEIMVLSAENEAGEKLLGLGGIAALLRFPID